MALNHRVRPRRVWAGARWHPWILASLSIYGLHGCQRATQAPRLATIEPAQVVVIPAELTVRVGERAQLAAQVNDAQGRPIGGSAIIFRNDTPLLLTVNEQGGVTAVGPTGQGSVTVVSGVRERRVPVQIVPGSLQQLEKLSGDMQTVTAGDALAEPLRIRALDQAGNPVQNAPEQRQQK